MIMGVTTFDKFNKNKNMKRYYELNEEKEKECFKKTEQIRQYGRYCYKKFSEGEKEMKSGYGRDFFRTLSNYKKEKLKKWGRN